ncbi:hypothetical protein Q5691_27025 [Microcoleus sp. w1-18aA5]|uniref:hypothetical protein n=1 Tax=Microcoleus sp. w1-18aA5 TaxID=2818982 RepID=UPI002FD02370
MTFSVVQGILEPEYGSMIQIDTKCWFTWLTENDSFRYESNNHPSFRARKEKKYWYGYRKVDGKLYKRYIGISNEVTQDRLEQTAEEFVEISTPDKTERKASKKEVTQTVEKKVTDTVTHDRIAALEARLQLMEERLGKLKA